MKTLIASAVAVVSCIFSFAAMAEDINVADGGSFALDGESNVAGNRLVFPTSGDATLTLTGAGEGETTLLAQIISSGSGAITLAVADGTGKTLRLKNHVSVNGSLAFSGDATVKFGDTAMTPAIVDAATSLVAAFPAFDVATLASAITIDGAAQIAALPTTGADNITMDSTAFLALTAPLALGEKDTYDLNYDVMIAHTNAFKWKATLNVANGKTLGYVPLKVASDFSWTEDFGEHKNSFNAVLGAGVDGATAQFHIWAKGKDYGISSGTVDLHIFTGVFSGTGDVKILPMMDKGQDKRAWLECRFDGRQSFKGLLYSINSNINIYTGVPEDGVCPFSFDLQRIDYLIVYSGFETYGSYNVTIPSFKSNYFSTTLYPHSGQTITIKELSGGGFNIVGVGESKCHVIIENNLSASGTTLRSQGAKLTLDENTLKYNNYYEIDTPSNPRRWYYGNGVKSLSTVTSAVGVGVPVGRTLDITTLSANKECVVEEGATVTIGTMDTGSYVVAADSATVNVGTQKAGTTITVGDNANLTVTTLGGNNTITAGENANVKVSDPNCDTLTLNVGKNTTTQLYDIRDSWQNAATLWCDASMPETIHSLTNAAGVAQTQSNSGGYDSKAWWYDCRPTHTRYYLYNDRCYRPKQGADTSYVPSITYVNPWYQPTGGPGGDTGFVHFDKAYEAAQKARLDLHTTDSTLETVTSLPVKYVVMVYGASASDGTKGGVSLFTENETNKTYPMLRTASMDAPMVADVNTTVTVRKNGAAAESAATATFDEGWQILGLSTEGHTFSGIGYGKRGYTSGGQKVAEVMLFETMPTEAQKADIEAYLSEKWGIPVASSATTRTTIAPTVNGSGTVKANGCNLDLSKGSFVGSVDLTGGTLTIGGENNAPVPTATDLPKQDDILSWFDPSKMDSVQLTEIPEATVKANPGSEQTNEVSWVLDRRGAADYPLTLSSCNTRARSTSSRRGYLVWRDHASGEQMPWIDCNGHYLEQNGTTISLNAWGNAYRFNNYDVKTGTVAWGTDLPINIATAFIVQDSALGGSSPILNKFSGDNCYLRTTTDPKAALWKTGVAESLTGGSVYVNGTKVANPLVSAEFTGGQEVLTIQTKSTTTFPAKAVGDWNDSQNKARSATYGEILFYSAELTDEERKTVEAYLAWKWNSKMIHDYKCYSAVTLDGSAAYTAASVAKLPKVAASYTGALKLEQSVFAITADPVQGTVTGGFDVSAGGELTLPASVKVAVTLTSKMRSGTSIKLLSWKSLATGTTFTLDGVTDGGTRPYVLRKTDDGLYLDAEVLGSIIMLR